MKKLMDVKRKTNNFNRIFKTKYGTVRIPEAEIEGKEFSECYEIVGKRLGRNLESENADVEDFGLTREYRTVGMVYEKDGKYFLDIDGKTEEKDAETVAYWGYVATHLEGSFPSLIWD